MTGWIQPEDFVHGAVDSGRQMILSALGDGTITELVGRIFASSDRQPAIVQWFSEHRIELVWGWPPQQQTLPCWCIILLSGQNSVQYVGDAGDDGADGSGLGDAAERWADAIGILSRDENADVVRWLHQLAKWSLSRARVNLSQRFPYRQQATEQDLKPEEIAGANGGRIVRQRLLTFNCEYDQTDVGPLADQDTVVDTILPENVNEYANTEF